MSKDLLKEMQHLEELFTIDTAKLKQITAHFVKELEKGKV
jgi:hexokinase